jgi:hypothetical protein
MMLDVARNLHPTSGDQFEPDDMVFAPASPEEDGEIRKPVHTLLDIRDGGSGAFT